MPKEIEKAPKLLPGLFFYLQAFYALHYDRPGGQIVMPIPRHSIRDYAIEYGLEQEQTANLHYYVRALDDAYLKRVMPKKLPPAAKKGKSNARDDAT